MARPAGRWTTTPLSLAGAGALLLLASGVLATGVSYDPAMSSRILALLGGGALVGAAVGTRRVGPAWVMAALALGGVALACYFLLQNDFEQRSKFAVVRALSGLWHGLAPDLGWHKPHPNIAAGALEVALPLGLGLALATRGVGRALALFGAGVCAFALFMTESRGAWAALAAAGAVAGFGYLYWGRRTGRVSARAARLGAAGIGLGAIAAAGGLLVITLRQPALVGSFLDRLRLYQAALALVGDYPFTGAGLGSFAPTFSQYILFHGHPPEPHAHNLWLDLWIAQGVGAVLGYALLTLAAGWVALRVVRAGGAAGPLFWAALVAWLILLIHGLADDVHYESVAAPLVLILPALVLGTAPRLPGGARARTRVVSRRMAFALAAPVTGLLLALVFAAPPLLSLGAGNLGNLAQARRDLGGDPAPATAAAADHGLTLAWQIWPANPGSGRRAAFFYLAQRQLDRAVAYQRATGAPVEDWAWMARDLAHAGADPAYVLAIDRQAVDLGTRNPLAYYALAADAATRAAWGEAAAQQARAVQLDSAPSVEQYVALGDWQRQAGDAPAARAAYQQALVLAPGNAQAISGLQQLGGEH